MRVSRAGRWALVLVLIVAASACFPFKKKPPTPPPGASAPLPPPPPPVPLTLTVQTSPTVNPGESGRATTIVVRVYQLRSDESFRAAPYDKLLEDAKGTLGQDLIGEATSVTLRPNDQSTLSLMVAGDAKFVGVAAFFRQYNGIQWKLPIPTPLKGAGVVLVDTASLSFTAK